MQGMPLIPDEAVPGSGADAYERAVAARGMLGVREGDWHDLMNVLAWRTFPQAKAVINARHVAELDASGRLGARSPGRDALTLFDESGIVVASADPELTRLLRGFCWRELFVVRRADVLRSMRFLVLGHGLLDKARSPFIGLTGHACIVAASAGELALDAHALARCLDPRIACAVEGLKTARDLAPLPVLGVPGWWPANESPAFYDDTRYFRPGRSRDRVARSAG
jgi:hypothetical protein